MEKTNIFKYFSILLLYPELELKQNITLYLENIKNEKIFIDNDINILINFITYIKNNDLISLQENYVSIFDRQKKLSLYLFEHIHGDSKNRGSAMIDLKNLYNKHNLDINKSNELPDYIPLFLEFLSTLPYSDSIKLLDNVINIISIIKINLKTIKSPYYNIFLLLEKLSNKKTDEKIIKNLNKIYNQEKINTIDDVWKEEKIFFRG